MSHTFYQRDPRSMGTCRIASRVSYTIFVYPTPLQQFGNPEQDIMKCYHHNFPEKAHKKSTGSEKDCGGRTNFFN